MPMWFNRLGAPASIKGEVDYIRDYVNSLPVYPDKSGFSDWQYHLREDYMSLKKRFEYARTFYRGRDEFIEEVYYHQELIDSLWQGGLITEEEYHKHCAMLNQLIEDALRATEQGGVTVFGYLAQKLRAKAAELGRYEINLHYFPTLHFAYTPAANGYLTPGIPRIPRELFAQEGRDMFHWFALRKLYDKEAGRLYCWHEPYVFTAERSLGLV